VWQASFDLADGVRAHACALGKLLLSQACRPSMPSQQITESRMWHHIHNVPLLYIPALLPVDAVSLIARY
jgi:hypothetical protein